MDFAGAAIPLTEEGLLRACDRLGVGQNGALGRPQDREPRLGVALRPPAEGPRARAGPGGGPRSLRDAKDEG